MKHNFRLLVVLAGLAVPIISAHSECQLEGKIKSFGVDGKVIVVRVTDADGTQKRVVKFCSNISQESAVAPGQSNQALEFIKLAMRNNYRVCLNSSGFFESCIDEVKIQTASFEN